MGETAIKSHLNIFLELVSSHLKASPSLPLQNDGPPAVENLPATQVHYQVPEGVKQWKPSKLK